MKQASFQEIWGSYVDLLCCPHCKGQDAGLLYKNAAGREALGCGNCHFEFPIINAVPILLSRERMGMARAIEESVNTNGTSSAGIAAGPPRALADFKYLSFQYYSRFCEFKKTLVNFQPQNIVLDVGCAGGSIANSFKNYIGLDNSWRLISFARRHSDKPFALADAENIPFKTNAADHVISRQLLEHTAGDREIIKEMSRVCRLNGVFELPCSDGVSFLMDPVNTLRAKMGLPPKPFFSYGFGHINMQTEKEWTARLTENGFNIIGKKCLGRGVVFKLATFLEFLLFSFGGYDRVPAKLIPEKKLRFIHSVYDLVYKLDPKTKKSWSRVFIVSPNK